MSKQFATNIDLLLNELQNAKIHVVASDPSSPAEGQIYYNSTSKTLRFYNGSAWVQLGYLNQITATGAISVNNQKITSLAEPTASSDAATKNYVDTVAQGLDAKPSVVCATTANITLSGTQTIDGVAVVAGDRVLVKNQTTASGNGIYTVSASSWTRVEDCSTWSELIGAFTFVEKGTVNADTGWLCSIDAGGTLGTTAITFVQFSAAGQITAESLGTSGAEVFSSKNGLVLQFRRLTTPTNQGAITLTQNTDDISIAASAKIEALHDLSTNGLVAQTGTSTFAGRTITGPAAGITITNGNGVSGNPTIALANDLAAVEGLSTTGMATRTADGAWTTRTITAGTGVTISNGNGVSGNPTISVDPSTLHDTQSVVRYWTSTFTFVSSGTDIALTHNLALPTGSYNDYMIKVVETASRTQVEVDVGSTANTNNIAYIKMTGTGLTTTTGYYTAIIHA